MIIIRIMGGLGNQMFQYAFAKSLQEQGEEVKLDITYYEKIPNIDTMRYYELNIFECTIPLATKKEIRKYCNIYEMVKAKLRHFLPVFNSRIIFETDTLDDNILVDFKDKYYIGYWQNEKYFKEIQQDILKEFTFAEEMILEETKEMLEQINQAEVSVSVHIRGGDYLNSINNSIYGNICTEDYYIKAYEYFKNRYEKVSFFVFSNDMELAKKYFGTINANMTFVNMNSERKDWEDMFLMTKCTHNIIANSTFSWWAAWLNSYPYKEVIAPSKWTNNSAYSPVCSSWIKM